MKTLILSLLMFFSAQSIAQDLQFEARVMANVIQEHTSAVVESHRYDPNQGYYLHFFEFPSYYDFELLRLEMDMVPRTYSDVRVSHNWERTEAGRLSCSWVADDIMYTFVYSPNSRLLVMATQYIE